MNRFKVVIVDKIEGQREVAVVLETIEGSISAVRNPLIDEETAEEWLLISIGSYIPNDSERPKNRSLVALEGDSAPTIGLILSERNWS